VFISVRLWLIFLVAGKTRVRRTKMDPKKSDLNVKAAADALMAQANEAAAIFTQYDQD